MPASPSSPTPANSTSPAPVPGKDASVNNAKPKVPLHQKLRRVDNPAKGQRNEKTGKSPLTLGRNIDQQILTAVGGNFNEKTVRTKLLQIALSCDGAIGACFVTRDVRSMVAFDLTTNRWQNPKPAEIRGNSFRKMRRL